MLKFDVVTIHILIRNDRSGGKIGVNYDLNTFIAWRTRTARKIVASNFLCIVITSFSFNSPYGRWCAFSIVDALEGGTTGKGIFTYEANCLWEINLTG